MATKSGVVRTHTFEFDGRQMRRGRRGQLVDMIAREYLSDDAEVDTAEVREAYAELAETNARLFEQIPVRVEFTESDPYDSYEQMVREVEESGVLRIFGGGTHPGGMSREDNLKGRAVHDWFGHIEMGVDFSLEGEWSKWRGMSTHYSPVVQKLLFTEVVGQLAVAIHLGGFDSAEFVQRGIIAPDHWLEEAERYMRLYNRWY